MSDDVLIHEGRSKLDGAPVGSGRYPLGSGENPNQHDGGTFRAEVKKLRKEGMKDTDIARFLGMSTGEFRSRMSIAKNEELSERNARIRYLKDEKQYGWAEIARIMNLPDTTCRDAYKTATAERTKITNNVADILRNSVKEKKYVDVGVGTENYINCSRTRLATALQQLKDEGYVVLDPQVEQLGTGKKTNQMILCPPGTTKKEVYDHLGDVKLVTDYIENEDRTVLNMERPKSIDSSRVMIRYNEEGGNDKDGVMEIRRGVKDLSLGNAAYAQVRIAVDDKSYLKGMAIYSDGKDMPDGVDVIFNTNKHVGTPFEKVLKPLKKVKVNGQETDEIDWDNPFGASIKNQDQLRIIQQHYTDDKGNKQLSSINVVNEQGTWETWSKTLSSQFLSKQSPELAKKQLDLTYAQKAAEYDDICKLTNPTVKKYFLDKFAEQCDSDAVQLKAAALPRQTNSVIIPIPSLKDNEIYAPNYKNGEEVVLIRHPHGGIFEIPRLIVNNNNKEGAKVIGPNHRDAVGINKHVADQLSGADFDGDTVIVIPTAGQKIKTSKPLEGLKDFDAKEQYAGYEGMPVISNRTKQIEMGKVSNLITDMTLQGADDSELARAVRHSMVIIDAEKHKLNYKQSAKDNRISELKEKYQGGPNAGASTLISKASSEIDVYERKAYWKTNPETGEKIYTETGRTEMERKKDKNGNWHDTGRYVRVTQKSTRMAEETDAMNLSSGTRMEGIYGNYANQMKALANKARKESLFTEAPPRSASARTAYSEEVESLNRKLDMAEKNRPLERQAQRLANVNIRMRIRDNPAIKKDKDAYKKLKNQSLEAARYRVGANKKNSAVHITPKEWEAIQAMAISSTQLVKILNNSDTDEIRNYATPKANRGLAPSKVATAKRMASNGYSIADIASQLGVSTSTISKAIND